MSLRLRLSLLYTLIMGGVLLLFGTLVYSMVSFILLDQIDNRLYVAVGQIIDRLRVNPKNQFDSRSVSAFQPTENLVFQVWDSEHNLQFSRPGGLLSPLDSSSLRIGQSLYSKQSINNIPLRVLSVPLRTNRGPVGYLQVGISLGLVEITQHVIAIVLVVFTAIMMVLVGGSTWVLTGRALSRLGAVTRVASKITQTDDLSYRIPIKGSLDDEIGQLILAFNDTLERLEKLFNTQRRFLADVSHELRTPLTVIKGEVGLMQLTGSVDAESIHSIGIEVDRLTRLVGDLLLLAQAESGRLPLEMNPVEMDTVVLEVCQAMSKLVAGKLSLHLDEIDQVEVIGDRDRLKQVMLNLVANAVEYTPQGGEIHIVLRKSEGKAQFVVKDTGPGIQAEDIPHIFERFYRAERSRKRRGDSGFGLGLSIAHWIVTGHHGRIEVESLPGSGAKFTVILPLPEQN